MVDPDRVRRLIQSIEYWRDRIIGEDEPSDPLRLRYAVQSAAQSSIDLANHLISSEGWRVPRDYGDAFSVLSENDILDENIAERFRALAGLRNLLVHAYSDIDDSRVSAEARERVGDLDLFIAQVARLLTDEDP